LFQSARNFFPGFIALCRQDTLAGESWFCWPRGRRHLLVRLLWLGPVCTQAVWRRGLLRVPRLGDRMTAGFTGFFFLATMASEPLAYLNPVDSSCLALVKKSGPAVCAITEPTMQLPHNRHQQECSHSQQYLFHLFLLFQVDLDIDIQIALSLPVFKIIRRNLFVFSLQVSRP
jgi:hypothetical protein